MLHLKDFSVISNNSTRVNKNVAALTRTGISYYITTHKLNGKPERITVTVEATVYKRNTFIKERVLGYDAKIQQRLLEHEQKHFDISEIFARQAVGYLKTAKLTQNYQKEIAHFVQAKFKAAELYQHRYDRETQHGENRPAQEAWNADIEAQLRRLEAHKRKVVERQLPRR